MRRIYIAGPIHSPVPVDKEICKARFNTLEEWFAVNVPEWAVVNPLKCLPGCFEDVSCEDLSGLPSGGGHSWECWMRGDLREMLTCDSIVLLPHWEASNGASLEQSVAEALRMRMYVAWPLGGDESDGSNDWDVHKKE